MNHAGDTALELAAHRDDETLAADGDEIILRGTFAGKFAQRGAQALLDETLLPLLLPAEAVQLRRSIVRKRAVGLNFSLDRFCQPPQRRRPVVGDPG